MNNMKLVDLTVQDFIDEVASSSPAPGGGSVAALASSLGMALTKMVGNFSVTKKKFKDLDEDTKDKFIKVIDEIDKKREVLTQIIDKDTEAFNLIMNAFKLPKETESEKKERSKAIQEATLKAAMVPLEVSKVCLSSLHQIESILPYINRNTMSDLGVSVLMIHAGFEGAIMNVLINVGGLKDEVIKSELEDLCQTSLLEMRIKKEALLETIYKKL